MKLHLGPFLEMHFYFADCSDQESLRRVLVALQEGGAHYTGSALAHKGQQSFGSVSDQQRLAVPLFNLNDYDRYCYQNEYQIVQIGMLNASTLYSDFEEIVTYSSISTAATLTDHHPVSIWTDGADFHDRHLGAIHHQRLGQRCYQRFRWLCCNLQPSYASISFNGSLICPSDLQQFAKQPLFQDFFLNDSYLGIDSYILFQAISPALYIEKIDDSSYVSTSRFFNPFASCAERSLIYEVNHCAIEAISVAHQRLFRYQAREALNQRQT
jgi:hypothetical protein